MNWSVCFGTEEVSCAVPANVGCDTDISATVAGEECRIRWHAGVGRLTLLHALDGGGYLEEYLQLEQVDVRAFKGGAEVSLFYWQGGVLRQLCGRVGLALALRARQQSGVESEQTIASPLTGKVIQVHAVVGEQVKKGDLLYVIEAMKMENRIQSPADATIVEAHAAVNTSVNVGDTLLKLQT